MLQKYHKQKQIANTDCPQCGHHIGPHNVRKPKTGKATIHKMTRWSVCPTL
jgi:ribosomal protein L32